MRISDKSLEDLMSNIRSRSGLFTEEQLEWIYAKANNELALRELDRGEEGYDTYSRRK